MHIYNKTLRFYKHLIIFYVARTCLHIQQNKKQKNKKKIKEKKKNDIKQTL